jgi:hypothetical protein
MAIDLASIRSEAKPSRMMGATGEVSPEILQRLGDVPDNILKDKELVRNFAFQQATKYYNIVYQEEIKASEGGIPSVEEAFGAGFTKVSVDLGQGELTQEDSQVLEGWTASLQSKMAKSTPDASVKQLGDEVDALYKELLESGKLNSSPGGGGAGAEDMPADSFMEMYLMSHLQSEYLEIENKYQASIQEAKDSGNVYMWILMTMEMMRDKKGRQLSEVINLMGQKDNEILNIQNQADLLGEGGIPDPAKMVSMQTDIQQTFMKTSSLTQLAQYIKGDMDKIEQHGSSTIAAIDRYQQQVIRNVTV